MFPFIPQETGSAIRCSCLFLWRQELHLALVRWAWNIVLPQGEQGFPGGASGEESACQCARHEMQVRGSLGREDPLEEGTATNSSILAWGIPRPEEPGRLQSMESQSRTQLKRQHTPKESRDSWPRFWWSYIWVISTPKPPLCVSLVLDMGILSFLSLL